MANIIDFCKWAGDQRQAARKLKVSESTVSRAVAAGRFTVKLAKKAEKVSRGKFTAMEMLGL